MPLISHRQPARGLGVKDPAVAARFAHAGRRAVEALIDETIAAKAAFLLICGDIFDGDWRDVATGLFFVRALGRLERAGFQVSSSKATTTPKARCEQTALPESARIFSSRAAQSHHIGRAARFLHGRSFASRLVGEDL